MKIILLYNSKTDEVMIVDHNVADADAEIAVKALRKQDLPAYSCTQTKIHPRDHCRRCMKEIQDVTERIKQEHRRSP